MARESYKSGPLPLKRKGDKGAHKFSAICTLSPHPEVDGWGLSVEVTSPNTKRPLKFTETYSGCRSVEEAQKKVRVTLPYIAGAAVLECVASEVELPTITWQRA